MGGLILDGKSLASEIRKEIALEVNGMLIKPGLSVVLVGEDPASMTYVNSKQKACREVGMGALEHRLKSSVSQDELLELIDQLNRDEKIHGILVQSPLPKHINENKIFNAISPKKDVDGFHPINMGQLLIGQATFVPCTPLGVKVILERNNIPVEGQNVVIVGRSTIVGRPLAALFSMKAGGANATVTLCHSRTRDLSEHTLKADIVIAAIGIPRFIKASMVREGVVVVDVGINRIEDSFKKSGFRLCGDVDFESVAQKAKAITPVPGGVGPMTVAMLLRNTLQAAKLADRQERL